MTKTISVKHIQKNDTKANWEASSYILSQGEIGYATGDNIMKVGDGVHTWNNLQEIGGGGSYEPGSGIDITNNTISVTSPTLTNTATGTNAVGIGNNSVASGTRSIAIGGGSSSHHGGAQATQTMSIAIGANNNDNNSISATAIGAIQIGPGTNSTAGTFSVGLTTNGSTCNNYRLLGSDGKIPDDRLNTTIATTAWVNNKFQLVSALPASPDPNVWYAIPE